MKSLAPLTAFLRHTSSSSSHLLLLHPITSDHPERTTLGGPSHSFSSSPFPSPNDLSRKVKVSVWWDFENCNVPNGADAVRVSSNIISALRANGIRGPVTITAFGDFVQLSRTTQEVLACTGVLLNHVPSGGKNTADRSLLADLVFWVSQNPPPAHIFLISTDKDFASILHRLRMNNYNILLASNDPVPSVLCSAASIKWTWYDLIKKENFRGMLFNEPPDGTWESWYSHNRGPLEDPFVDMEQPAYVQAEASTDAVTVPKLRVIPEATVNQIRRIVNSYPEGVDISELRTKLSNNIGSKDFFGYKKFSLLLKSLPTVLKLKSSGDQIFAHGIQPKAAKPYGQLKAIQRGCQPKVAERVDFDVRECTKLESNDDNWSSTVTAEPSKIKKVATTDVNKISPLAAYSPQKTAPPIGPIENDVILTEGHSDQLGQNDSVSKVGFYQRSRRIIFGSECDTSISKSNGCPEICSSPFVSFERKEPEEKSNESVLKEKNRIKSEEIDTPNPRVGMFSNIVKWFKSWKTGKNPDNTVGSFLNSSKGASVISESTIRVEPDPLMQKEGPSRASSMLPNLHRTNGLSSRIQENLSHSTLQRPPNYETGDRKKKDIQHGAHSNESENKYLGKSKREILADCQMLVTEMFKEHPEGFNMGLFKISFRIRYGYDLEYHKLGYRRLASLLEAIPGVDTSFNFVLRSEKSLKMVTPYNYQNDGAVKVNNSESDDTMWNEPSPISETKSKSNCLRSGIIGEKTEGIEHKDYRDSELLEGFSELEEEFPNEDGSDGKSLANNNDDTVTVGNQDFDSMWKEYLPNSMTKSKNNCFRSEITSKRIEGSELVNSDVHSYLLDEPPEVEVEFSKGNASNVKCTTSNTEGDSSLVRLLDSYYSRKDASIKKPLESR